MKTSVWTLLPAASLATVMLAAGTAQASPLSVITNGTITSGTDAADLFGAGTNLSGGGYTLTIHYDGLGPSAFTDGTGQFATDSGDKLLGSITVTIGSNSLTTPIQFNSGASLIEDTSDILATLSGNAASGDTASASQSVGAGNNFIAYADLQTPFSYNLAAADLGADSYVFSNATNSQSVSFSGVPSSVVLAVPEPATWSLLGAGLLGLEMLRRRRR